MLIVIDVRFRRLCCYNKKKCVNEETHQKGWKNVVNIIKYNNIGKKKEQICSLKLKKNKQTAI